MVSLITLMSHGTHVTFSIWNVHEVCEVYKYNIQIRLPVYRKIRGSEHVECIVDGTLL